MLGATASLTSAQSKSIATNGTHRPPDHLYNTAALSFTKVLQQKMASPLDFDQNSLVADINREQTLAQKKKKVFDFLTSSVLMAQQKHLLASLHFKACYNNLLFVPSIAITLVAGILSVVVQADFASEIVKTTCALMITVLAGFSVFWQSLMKQLDYGGRASLHDSAANALHKIFINATMHAREESMKDLDHKQAVLSERRQSTLSTGSQNIGDASSLKTPLLAVSAEEKGAGGEEHSSLSKQFEQATQGCTSVVPIKITAAFNSLESRINVCNKNLVSGGAKSKISWEKVYPALYHQMTLTIIGSRLWPYVVPDAKWAVNKTIKDFQSMDGYLLKVVVDRAQMIDDHYSTV